jgi:ubiquitin-protein ligase
MELDFKTLTMMQLRNSPGEILDKVHEGEAYVIERNGRKKACLVPIWYFFPDIPKNRILKEINKLHENGKEPYQQSISDQNEAILYFKEIVDNNALTIKIILPHGYPNLAPKLYITPIRADAPHQWQDGSVCIFGAMLSWNPGKHDISFTLELANKWLKNYSEWQKTNIWPGSEGDQQ